MGKVVGCGCTVEGLVCLDALLLLFILPVVTRRPLFPAPTGIRGKGNSFIVKGGLRMRNGNKCTSGLTTKLRARLGRTNLRSSPTDKAVHLRLAGSYGVTSRTCALIIRPGDVLLRTSSRTNLFCTGRTLLRLSHFNGNGIHTYGVRSRPHCN